MVKFYVLRLKANIDSKYYGSKKTKVDKYNSYLWELPPPRGCAGVE